MKIEVVLTETEIVQELVEAVESRDLPEKLFYWGPLPVRTWMALTGDPSFDGARPCWKQLAGRSAWLTEGFKDAIPVISLGAGDGATDRLLLDAICACGREQIYFPVDASQSLLEIACAGAEDLDIDTSGIKADIASPMHLVFASDAAESPKLILMSGNTLGGFDPMVQVRHMAECVHPGDRLVLDGEIFQDLQDAHMDESMRQLAFAPLAGLGLSLEDGEVRVEHKRDGSLDGLHVTSTYFRPDRDLRISVLGRDVLVERGEHIQLKFWYRFSAKALRTLVGKHGGLKILEEIPSPDGRHLLVVCARR